MLLLVSCFPAVIALAIGWHLHGLQFISPDSLRHGGCLIFLYGNSDCLACCLSMGFDVLADGDKSKVKAWKGSMDRGLVFWRAQTKGSAF